nr:putative IS66 family transposase [Magnetospirillum gryphiswaldense MSR-1]CAJ30166.1 putative IS66 family transposase [Magnetospirillum gryphiswaldense MSR-1]CAJ30177.1 putative IS66 family transposase [Magnetospirillum gryphiswaldense MSR-1]
MAQAFRGTTGRDGAGPYGAGGGGRGHGGLRAEGSLFFCRRGGDRSGWWLPCPCRRWCRCPAAVPGLGRAGAAMIPVPTGVRVWLAVGRTDMRRGMNGLALQVQEALGRDPHAGDLFVFRGARGDLIKVLWHDGLGMSLYAKRLEKGRFIWPSPADGVVAISSAQLAYMLDGIDWRNPRHTFRPRSAG